MSFDLNDIAPQAGRTAIVTGANAGLGYETALGLAKTGMRVVLACRDAEKAGVARERILAEVPGADLGLIPLDLASLADVRRFADEFRAAHERLDILVNNAGLMVPPYSLTEDGFESQFGVNYLGHFLLTDLLIDLLPDTPESRVVTVSSLAHRFGKIHFDDLQWEKAYSKWPAYGQSKLACLMFALELQRRLEAAGSRVLSVAAHPGSSRTELQRHTGLLNSLMNSVHIMSQSAAAGALPTLRAALGASVQGGDYFGPSGFQELTGHAAVARKSRAATDPEAAARLWEVSERLTGARFVFAGLDEAADRPAG